MPAVSPDGRYVVVQSEGPEGKPMLWLRALGRHETQRDSGDRRRVRAVLVAGQPVPRFLRRQGAQEGSPQRAKVYAPVRKKSAMPNLCRAAARGTAPASSSSRRARAPRSIRCPQWGQTRNRFKLNAARSTSTLIFGRNSCPTATISCSSCSPIPRRRRASTPARWIRRIIPCCSIRDQRGVLPAGVGGLGQHGYLLYIRDRSLMGVGFNASHLKLAGEPIPLAGRRGRRAEPFAGSHLDFRNAILVYQSVGPATPATFLGGPQRQTAGAGCRGRQLGTAPAFRRTEPAPSWRS
jgi:hypothetical protein